MMEFGIAMFGVVFLFLVLDRREKARVKVETKEYLKSKRKGRK